MRQADNESDWQETVVRLLTAPTRDLRELARLAGADPATFYAGAQMAGADLTGQDLSGMLLGRVTGELSEPEPAAPSVSPNVQSKEANAFTARLALHMDQITTQALGSPNGQVTEEATAIAFRRITGQNEVQAVGRQARSMIGKTPAHMRVVLPFVGGGIVDHEAAGILLKRLLPGMGARHQFGRLHILACSPAGASQLERRTMSDVCKAAGASKVTLVDIPIAAAIGLGLPFAEPRGTMVLNIGAGCTDLAILSSSEIIYSVTLDVGVSTLDRAVTDYLRHNHNLGVGVITGEIVRESLFNVPSYSNGPPEYVEVVGRDLFQGVPRQVRVTRREVAAAVVPLQNVIVNGVHRAWESINGRGVLGDLRRDGLFIAGVGSRLSGLPQAIEHELGVPCRVFEGSGTAAVRGAALILATPSILKALPR